MGVLGILENWIRRKFATAPTRSDAAVATAATALRSAKKPRMGGLPDAKRMKTYARELELNGLPNDLARLLYLASLRDCNSGIYLHPHLSHRMGTAQADHVLRSCHEDV